MVVDRLFATLSILKLSLHNSADFVFGKSFADICLLNARRDNYLCSEIAKCVQR